MPTATRYANSVGTSNNCTLPGNATGAPDGVFTADTGNVSWGGQWNFLEFTDGTVTGTQTVTIRVKKELTGGGNPTVSEIDIVQTNGTSITGNLISSTSVTSDSGQDIAATFDGSAVDGIAFGVQVVTTGAGGSPTNRRAVQLDGITWTVNYAAEVVSVNAGSATAAVAASDVTADVDDTLGDAGAVAVAAIANDATVTAISNITADAGLVTVAVESAEFQQEQGCLPKVLAHCK